MKKLLFIALALLLLVGVANAAGIPIAVDPANYPEIWTTQVYNNSSSALTSGRVVIWDFNSVTSPAEYTDRLNYVTTSTSADDIRIAGVVVSPSIAASGGIGAICIKGPVYALAADSTDALTASQAVGTTTVAGQCGQSGAAAVNTGILGYCIQASPNTVANGGYGGTDGNDFLMFPIYVNPSNN